MVFTVEDTCDSTLSRSLSVASDEPINGPATRTLLHWILHTAHHLQLRSERAGGGDGRTYTRRPTARTITGTPRRVTCWLRFPTISPATANAFSGFAGSGRSLLGSRAPSRSASSPGPACSRMRSTREGPGGEHRRRAAGSPSPLAGCRLRRPIRPDRHLLQRCAAGTWSGCRETSPWRSSRDRRWQWLPRAQPVAIWGAPVKEQICNDSVGKGERLLPKGIPGRTRIPGGVPRPARSPKPLTGGASRPSRPNRCRSAPSQEPQINRLSTRKPLPPRSS